MSANVLGAHTPLGVITTEYDTDTEGNAIGHVIKLYPDEGEPFIIARVFYDELAKGIYVSAHASGKNMPTDTIHIEAADAGSPGMNLDALRLDIQSEANKDEPTLVIEEESETDILTYDDDQERNVTYHLVTPTEEWLQSRIFIAPKVSSEWAELTGDRETIAKRLMNIDRNMLINLRHIIITTEEEEDLDAICEHIECEPCEVANFIDYLGMFWYAESAVIINVEAIRETTDQLKKELRLNNDEYKEDLAIGFFSTVFHEIRHLGLENPFLSELEYPDEEKDETCIEIWARNQTDSMIADIKHIATKSHERKE